MRLLIKYDAKGNILSVAKTAHIADSLAHPFADTEEGGGVLEVEESGDLAELECHEIHEQYRVDAKKQQLKKRPARRAR